MLHHSFSIALWARVTKDGDFVSISSSTLIDGSNHVMRLHTDLGKLRFNYSVGSNTIVDFSNLGDRFTYDDWHYFATIGAWSNGTDP